jgi:O-antigen ligase
MPPVSAAARRRVAQKRSPDAGIGLWLFFAVGLMFQMPSFVLVLSQGASGSVILQLASLITLIVSATLVLGAPDRKQILRTGAIPMAFVGIAFLSTLWSFNRANTFRSSIVLLASTLFTLAICSRLSPKACIALIIRMMSMACLLSLIWAVFFPETGVHHADDLIQSQHAGLWRGIFSHKQGLGVVSGLTTGLLLFYGSLAFPMIVRLAALGVALACVLGSGSITGLLVSILTAGLSYLSYWIACGSRQQRRAGIWAFIGLLVLAYLAFHFNLVNFIMPLLGKSADLSGRADCWPMVVENLRNTAPILGGGYVGGLDVAPNCSIDNGFIFELVDFGYVGGLVLVALVARSLIGAVKMVLSARPADALLWVFPLNALLIQLFIGISETYFLSKSISWVLVLVSMYQVALYQRGVAPTGAAAGRAGARQAGPSPLRNTRNPAYQRSPDPGNMRQ